jgi:hypothetical protein
VSFFFDTRILLIECNNKLHIKLIKKLIKKKYWKIIIFTSKIENLNKFLAFKEQIDTYFVKKPKILSIINHLCLYALLTIANYCLYVKNLTQSIYDDLIKLDYLDSKIKIEEKVNIYKKILIIPFYNGDRSNSKFISVLDFYKFNLEQINKIYKKKYTYKEIEEDIKLILKKIKIKKFIYLEKLKDDLLLKLAIKRHVKDRFVSLLLILLFMGVYLRRILIPKKIKFTKIHQFMKKFTFYKIHRKALKIKLKYSSTSYLNFIMILFKNALQR